MIANGLIIDMAKFDIVRTGSLFLKFSPEDAQVRLNGKTIRVDFGLLSGGALIKNLRPGMYEVEIMKVGNNAWIKNLAVQSGKVTSATKIILWPKKMTAKTVAEKNVQSFYVAGNTVITRQNAELFFENSPISGRGVASVHPNAKSIITEGALENYHLVSLDEPRKSLNINNLFNSLKQTKLKLPGTVPIKKVAFHPFSDNKIIVTTENSVYLLDTAKTDLERILNLPRIHSSALSQSELFAINSSGTVESFDLTLKRRGALPFPIPGAVNVGASKNGKFLAFSKPSGELLIFDRGKNSLLLLDKDVSEYRFSPEGRRIAYINKQKKLFVYHLENFDLDAKYEEGALLTPEGTVDGFEWLPEFPGYALIYSEGGLFISEVYDEELRTNEYEVSKDAAQYFYVEKHIYFLSSTGALVKIDL